MESNQPTESDRNRAENRYQSDQVRGMGAELNSLGLKGFWALVANSSAVVVLTLILIGTLWYATTMHREGTSILCKVIEDSDERMRLMDELHRAERKMLMAIVEKNSEAIANLATEVRLSRISRGEGK